MADSEKPAIGRKARKANYRGATSGQVERALTIGLIAVSKLETCTRDECPDQVRRRVGTQSPFDYLPVRDGTDGPIVGFFRIAATDGSGVASRVEDCKTSYEPLSEKRLIGSGVSILEFIRRVDDTPRPFLVVGEEGICGLANAADLANPIVGVAICARVLEFETRLNQWIEKQFGDSDEWEKSLDDGCLKAIVDRYNGARGRRIDAGRKWMYGTISDKMTILGVDGGTRKLIKGLRNEVFHTRPPSEVQEVLNVLEDTERRLTQHR
ncbi:MAG: hypothetical protein OXQ94_02425 [Gemmatimonadota bacterium]|nr:hypothetical protein [Gemmatimonadota bacterium]